MTIYIGIIGVGGVGAHFLFQLATLPAIRSGAGGAPALALVLLGRSSATVRSPDYKPIPTEAWSTALRNEAPASSTSYTHTAPALTLEETATFLAGAPGRAVLVDNTASEAVAGSYAGTFLARGVSVVTPNKKAFSSGGAEWDAIFATAQARHALVAHEATVGAGLPVLSTLRALTATGDRVRRIEGVFSGTLSFLFNTFAPVGGGGSSSSELPRWSDIVTQARAAGYTEPDPRDDLSGADVARKLTIVARLAGLPVASPDAIPVHSLVPEPLRSSTPPVSADAFMERLPAFDADMARLRDDAAADGMHVLRYVASADIDHVGTRGGGSKLTVSPQAVPVDGPIAGLRGSDNIFAFYTERYGARPLVVQGAGAGGAVTAMGVLADLLAVAERLG